MPWDRLGVSQDSAALVLVSGVGVYLAVLLLTRLSGSRSLATMSTFDFAATVAIGSTVSSAALGTSSLASGALALTVLFALQYAVTRLRRIGRVGSMLDPSPILLMSDGVAIDANLQHARVSRTELAAQLRRAGVQQIADVQAVVMETTGEISVIRSGSTIDSELLDGVRGAGTRA